MQHFCLPIQPTIRLLVRSTPQRCLCTSVFPLLLCILNRPLINHVCNYVCAYAYIRIQFTTNESTSMKLSYIDADIARSVTNRQTMCCNFIMSIVALTGFRFRTGADIFLFINLSPFGFHPFSCRVGTGSFFSRM